MPRLLRTATPWIAVQVANLTHSKWGPQRSYDLVVSIYRWHFSYAAGEDMRAFVMGLIVTDRSSATDFVIVPI